LRTREHLTPGEVETLIDAASTNRCGHRDSTMILLTHRHGAPRLDQSIISNWLTLKAAGCQVIRAEKRSGTTTEGRDALRTVLEFLHAGDILMSPASIASRAASETFRILFARSGRAARS
jgi:hypothetical protein